MDRYRFDPDPTFHFNTKIQIRILPQVTHILEHQKLFFAFIQFKPIPVYSVHLPHLCQRCPNFLYFGQHTEIVWRNHCISFHFVEWYGPDLDPAN